MKLILSEEKYSSLKLRGKIFWIILMESPAQKQQKRIFPTLQSAATNGQTLVRVKSEELHHLVTLLINMIIMNVVMTMVICNFGYDTI